MADLKKVNESGEATTNNYLRLGQCYGKLGQWDNAIRTYKRSFELEPDTINGTDTVLNLLQAWIVSERPEDGEQFTESVVQKKWHLHATNTDRLNQRLAMFYGFQAISQRMLGKDATEMEQLMRKYVPKTTMWDYSRWGWIAVIYEFRAISQRMLGKDATETEQLVRQYAAKAKMRDSTWRWQEIDNWLKTSKLAPDRKAAVEKIIAELKGIAPTPTPQK